MSSIDFTKRCFLGFEIAGACAGFIYALTLANGFVITQQAPVLIVAANILSRRINLLDRKTSVLFSDAAGAVLVAPASSPESRMLATHLNTDGSAYDMIQIPSGGSRRPFSDVKDNTETLMTISNGGAVFTKAVTMMVDSAQSTLRDCGLAAENVTHFIPHQANARMMDAVTDKLAIQRNRLRSSIAEFGNSSAATIPLTLSLTAEQGLLRHNDTILMTSAGAGLTSGEWPRGQRRRD